MSSSAYPVHGTDDLNCFGGSLQKGLAGRLVFAGFVPSVHWSHRFHVAERSASTRLSPTDSIISAASSARQSDRQAGYFSRGDTGCR